MSITRREFLAWSAALTGASLLDTPAFAKTEAAGPRLLTAGSFLRQFDPLSSQRTRVWGYDDSFPGPLLRAKRGERMTVLLQNDLQNVTTLHWHGMRVPNEMDGVPHVTQEPVGPGMRFEYSFIARDSGTFWYHPHQHSFEQVARGMYGPVIVDEDKPIAVDRDVVWMLSDLKLDARGQQVEDFGRVRDMANEGRIGNQIVVNGAIAGTAKLEVRAGERLRLRLINAATARIFKLQIADHTPTVIAYDGQAVEPHPLPQGGLMLGPGMRVDLVLDCLGKPGTAAAITDQGRGALITLGQIVYRDQAPLRSGALGAPLRLTPNDLPEPDLSKATDHYIVFQGGMRGTPVIGRIDNRTVKIQEIMEKHGLAWTMNFTAEHEHALVHEPMLQLRVGEHVVLRMLNETDYAHPMHLHGHFFKVVAVDGKKPARSEWRDTVLMQPRQTIDVAFVADNPGEWMFHCHILEHAAGGMMGTIAVD